MKSVMTHQFSQVPRAEIPRSSFDRSHGVKTTFDAGKLIPFFVDEALPGDTFNLRTDGFARLSTPIHPVMDNMFLETFYFAVPYRLVWANFKKMMGEQTNPGDSTDFTLPTLTTSSHGEQTLADYFGVPTKTALTYNSLPYRAYNLIYSEWFRDQNLQNSPTLTTGDGPDSAAQFGENFTPFTRGKRHDYFTSCLPWPQKGTEVTLPLGTIAPIELSGTNETVYVRKSSDGTIYTPGVAQSINANTTGVFEANDGTDLFYDPGNTLQTDLSSATSATINQLRQAFQIQKMYERDARGGTRYIEIVKSHFGVTSPDARLQRPEYLGGGSSRVNITPIAQTSETGTTAQGSLAAMGTASFSGHGFTKSFTEHSIIIGIVNVRADLTYQQGLNRMWSRSDRLDFYWPALAQIGEQAVLNKEIYAQGTSADEDVFGYQERFAEYRYKPSMVCGLFRSNATTSLDSWHLSQEFSSLPTLGDTFIKDTPPIDRVIAVPSEPHFIADFYHNLRCARPMPLYGVPGNIDRF